MVMRIGTNVNSRLVQSRLTQASDSVNRISERLSSGMRINRASDDAAGLAISSSLRAQNRIAGQSIRNLNDGISALSIAEGSIDSLTSILGRIEELSTQAMNGTSSDNQRTVMQKEVTELQSEWNRIVSSTDFNGRQLLTGNDTRLVLQGGMGDTGAVGVQVGKEALAGGADNAAGGTTLVSRDSSASLGNGGTYCSAMSADGRYVVFISYATNLVSGDTNGQQDAFAKDTATGAVKRINTDSFGSQATSGALSNLTAISGDGRYVAFSTTSSNMVSGDSNGVNDVFIKDTVEGTTTRVSTDSSGNQGNSLSVIQDISVDGRYVLFYSQASNLVAGDTNSSQDAFVKDRLTGATTRVTTDSSGNQGNGGGGEGAISASGRYVAFSSSSTNLVSGDTNGVSDCFIKDTVTGITTRVSTDSSATQSNGGSNVTSVSDDGRYVAFWSDATNLVSGDTNGVRDAFIKDTVTGITTRVSTDSSAAQGNATSEVTDISADGRYVAFRSSATNLVTGDTNGQQDCFIKDTTTGMTTMVSVNSSGTQANAQSGTSLNNEPRLSADGRYVAFSSNSTNLVAGDTNAVADTFVRDLTKAGIQTLAGMVVNNQVSAGITMNLIQTYRPELITYRANLGASMSRIQSYLSAVGDSRLTTVEATSRIGDADIAEEVAGLTSANIRQQVSASLLAQADKEPELVLRLLRNL